MKDIFMELYPKLDNTLQYGLNRVNKTNDFFYCRNKWEKKESKILNK